MKNKVIFTERGTNMDKKKKLMITGAAVITVLLVVIVAIFMNGDDDSNKENTTTASEQVTTTVAGADSTTVAIENMTDTEGNEIPDIIEIVTNEDGEVVEIITSETKAPAEGETTNYWDNVIIFEGDEPPTKAESTTSAEEQVGQDEDPTTQADVDVEEPTEGETESISEAYPGQAEGWSPIVSPDDLR